MSELQRIERHAKHALNDATWAREAARRLTAQPDFETRAEDALNLAAIQLEEALSAVRQAITAFRAKPVQKSA
jgi:hypothetical protein